MIHKNRHRDIINRYKGGETLASIGESYGVTRERIRQILKKHGLTGKDGGCTATASKRAFNIAREKSERKCASKLKSFGCTTIQYDEITRGLKSTDRSNPVYIYRQQRNNARRRGISFNLTLPEWWNIWQESGHWNSRGIGKGKYAMARIADLGGYEKGNVEIIECSKNSKDYYDIHFDEWYEKLHGKNKINHIRRK